MRHLTKGPACLALFCVSCLVAASDLCGANDARPTMAVLEFANRDARVTNDWRCVAFQDQIVRDALRLDRFTVLERERLLTILEEHELQASGLVDETSRVRFGRLAAVDYVVSGDFVEDGGSLSVVALAIDTGSGKPVAAASVKGAAVQLLALEQQLASQLYGQPWSGVTVDDIARIAERPRWSLPLAEDYYRGLQAFASGLPDVAFERALSAITQDAQFAPARLLLGNVFTTAGEYEHAVFTLEDALRLAGPQEPEAAEAAMALASVYHTRLFIGPRAARAYLRAAGRQPQHGKAYAGQAGAIFQQIGDLLSAYEAYRSVGHEETMEVYGELLRKHGPIVEAPLPPKRILGPRNRDIHLTCQNGDSGGWFMVQPGYRITGYSLRAVRRKPPALPDSAVVSVDILAVAPERRTVSFVTVKMGQEEVVERSEQLQIPSQVVRVFVQTRGIDAECGLRFDFAEVDEQPADPVVEPAISELPGPAAEKNSVKTPARYNYAFPELLRTASGTYWLAFCDFPSYGLQVVNPTEASSDIWITSSPDAWHWAPPIILPVNTGGCDAYPALVENEDRGITLYWSYARPGVTKSCIRTSSSTDGRIWTPARACTFDSSLDTSDMDCPQVVRDRQGTWHMVCKQKTGQRYYLVHARSDDGFHWRDAQRLSEQAFSFAPHTFKGRVFRETHSFGFNHLALCAERGELLVLFENPQRETHLFVSRNGMSWQALAPLKAEGKPLWHWMPLVLGQGQLKLACSYSAGGNRLQTWSTADMSTWTQTPWLKRNLPRFTYDPKMVWCDGAPGEVYYVGICEEGLTVWRMDAAFNVVLADGRGSLPAATPRLLTDPPLQDRDAGDLPTLVVLPFADTSGGQEATPVAAALTDLVQSHLSLVPSLKVVDREELSRLIHEMGRISEADMIRMGQLTGASRLVVGTCRPSGGEMQVQWRVIDVESGAVTGSAEASGSASALMDLSAKIAEDVCRRCKVDAPSVELLRVDRMPMSNRQLMRGLIAFHTGDLPAAASAFRSATSLDSRNTEARPWLVEAYLALGLWSHAVVEIERVGDRLSNVAELQWADRLRRAGTAELTDEERTLLKDLRIE